MKTARYLDEEIVVKKGVEALIKALGPVDAMRFIAMPKMKRMESVKRHRKWQDQLKKEVFFKEVFGS